jgi:uncharacterized protein YndB with AHSA1/START domain
MRDVQAAIIIHASPRNTLEAFTNLKAMQDWWKVESGIVELQTMGLWAMAWGASERGNEYVVTAYIASYNPDSHLYLNNYVYFSPGRMPLGSMQLFIDVQSHESGTFLSVRQAGYREGVDWDWYYESVKAAWVHVLEIVKQFVEKGYNEAHPIQKFSV